MRGVSPAPKSRPLWTSVEVRVDQLSCEENRTCALAGNTQTGLESHQRLLRVQLLRSALPLQRPHPARDAAGFAASHPLCQSSGHARALPESDTLIEDWDRSPAEGCGRTPSIRHILGGLHGPADPNTEVEDAITSPRSISTAALFRTCSSTRMDPFCYEANVCFRPIAAAAQCTTWSPGVVTTILSRSCMHQRPRLQRGRSKPARVTPHSPSRQEHFRSGTGLPQ
jgi:hypothetical protein